MSQNIENHVNLLKKEIYDITRNINNVGNKSHTTVTNIVRRLKNFTTDFDQNNFPINNNIINTNIYTEQNKPNIKSLKQNYRRKSNFNCYRNKNINCYFQNESKTNLDINNPVIKTQTNENNNYNKKYTISSSMFQNYSQRTKYDDLKKDKSKNLKKYYKSKKNKNTDNNIIQRQKTSNDIHDYKWNNEYHDTKDTTLNKGNKTSKSSNKDVYIKKNNVRYNKIEKIKNKLKCDDNEVYTKKNEIINCFSFVEKIQKIYNKCNNNSDNISGGDFNSILKWINHLAHKNKYEKFCLRVMKENNIKNFNDFKKKIYELMYNQKKENYFLNDMKKILCSNNNDDYVKRNTKRCKTAERMTIENFDDITFT